MSVGKSYFSNRSNWYRALASSKKIKRKQVMRHFLGMRLCILFSLPKYYQKSCQFIHLLWARTDNFIWISVLCTEQGICIHIHWETKLDLRTSTKKVFFATCRHKEWDVLSIFDYDSLEPKRIKNYTSMLSKLRSRLHKFLVRFLFIYLGPGHNYRCDSFLEWRKRFLFAHTKNFGCKCSRFSVRSNGEKIWMINLSLNMKPELTFVYV